jgi:hypothetical protein
MRGSQDWNIQGRGTDGYDGPADGCGYGGPSNGYGGPSNGYGGPSNGCDPAHSYDGPGRYDGPATEIPALPTREPQLHRLSNISAKPLRFRASTPWLAAALFCHRSCSSSSRARRPSCP